MPRILFQIEDFNPHSYDKAYMFACNLSPKKFQDFDVGYWEDAKDMDTDLELLANSGLPQGMFDVDIEHGILTFVKKPTDYIEQRCKEIKMFADKIDPDMLINHCSFCTEQFERIFNDGDKYMVYINQFGYAIHLFDWLMHVVQLYPLGTKFYVGGIVEFL